MKSKVAITLYGRGWIGVETNPHQTLIRLKNNIVFLSRIKVGFNPGLDRVWIGCIRGL